MGRIRLEEGVFVKTWKDADNVERVTPVIWIRYGDDGKRREESTGLSICRKGQAVPTPERLRSGLFQPHPTNVRTARAKRERNIALAREGDLPNVEARRATYDELATDLEDELRVNGRSGHRTRFKYARKHLDPFFSGMKTRRMTYNTILKYRQQQSDNRRANGSINRELQYLRQMLRLGHRRGKVTKLPDFMDLLLEEPKPRDVFIEFSEFKMLLERTRELYPYLVGFLEALFWTGWRWKKTVRALQWGDIRSGWLYAPGVKTKSGEPVKAWLGDGPLGDAVRRQREYVNAIQKRTGRVIPWMFCYPDGRQLRYPTEAFQKAARAAGHPELKLHDFCRSTWQVMVDAGVPEKDIMEHVGRKTRSIADRYNITSRRRLQNVGRKLAALDKETEVAPGQVAGLGGR